MRDDPDTSVKTFMAKGLFGKIAVLALIILLLIMSQ
jgi:hypothetical protein